MIVPTDRGSDVPAGAMVPHLAENTRERDCYERLPQTFNVLPGMGGRETTP